MKTPSPLSDSPRQESNPENPKKRPRRVSPAPSADSDPDWDPHLAADGDSLKAAGEGGMEAVEDGEEGELEEEVGGWDIGLEDELLCEKMIAMASKMSPDEDWVPSRQRWLKNYHKNKKCE